MTLSIFPKSKVDQQKKSFHSFCQCFPNQNKQEKHSCKHNWQNPFPPSELYTTALFGMLCCAQIVLIGVITLIVLPVHSWVSGNRLPGTVLLH